MRVYLARAPGGVAMESGGIAILERNVMPPLVLRSKRNGDQLLLPGGVTSVKELLDRWGVSEPERDRIPLLADRKGVLAVLGGALGYDSRSREDAGAGDRGNGPRMIVRVKSDREEGSEQQQR